MLNRGEVLKNTTEELLSRLVNIRKRSDLKTYIESNSKSSSEQLHDYILNICNKKGYDKRDIIKNADVNRTYGYQILNGFKKPSREKILQLCVGNSFTRAQINKALTIANLGILYAKNPRDSIVIYSLNNSVSLIDTNIILHEHDFESLG